MTKQDYTTVRVSKETMRRIEQIAAYLTLTTGKKCDNGEAIHFAASSTANELEFEVKYPEKAAKASKQKQPA